MMSKLSSIFLATLVALAVSVPMGSEARDFFLIDTLWRPSESETVATLNGEQVSELDLSLWLSMQDRDPAWLENWFQKTSDTAYSNRLKNTIRQYLETRELATLATQQGIETKLSPDTAGRILAGTPAIISWADLVVAYEVQVTDYDVSLYWQKNPKEYDRRKVQGDREDFIRDDIFLIIYPELFRQQLERSILKTAASQYPINRAEYLPLLEPEVAVLRVGDFDLTREQFFELYPEGANDTYRIRAVPVGIKDRVRNIIHGESIIRELDEQGLLAESWYDESKEIGRDIFLSRRWLSQPMTSEPTDEELAAYIKANIESLAPTQSYVTWALTSDSSSAITPLISRATQLLNERVEVSGPAAYALPGLVLDRLLSDQEIADTRFESLGSMTARNIEDQFGITESDIEIGTFSRTRTLSDGSVQSVYFAESRKLVRPETSVLQQLAREKIREDFLLSSVKSSITGAERSGALKWNF